METDSALPADKTGALRKAEGVGGPCHSHIVDGVTQAPTPGTGNFDMEEIAFFCRKEEFCFKDKKPLALTKCLIRR